MNLLFSQAAQKKNVCANSGKYSGLKYNEDFFVGYSPERINPEIK
jgi:UDP-N-acetyl-D-mannosaminuronate dehydrogenase